MTTGRPRGRSPRKNHSQRKTSAARRIVAPFEFRGHTLDEFQVQAIIALQQQMTTLVSAPTGTGKSLIADFLVDDSLKQDRRVVYTAPIKALVNQKYRDFRAAYGAQRTGIMTGDVTENPGAPLVVMTTEVLRNMLLRGGQPLVPPKVAAEAAEPGSTIADSTPADSAYDTVRPPLRADWIVFDEIHYINHPERGTVWEEAIMLLPPSLRLLGLSATVPNIDELAAWLENVKGEPVTAIVHDERAVPLRHYYFTHDGRTLTHRQAWEHFTGGDLKGDTLDNDVLGTAGLTGGKARRRRHRRAESDPSRHLDIISYVSRERLFPCIYFAFSRRACEQIARDLARRATSSGPTSARRSTPRCARCSTTPDCTPETCPDWRRCRKCGTEASASTTPAFCPSSNISWSVCWSAVFCVSCTRPKRSRSVSTCRYAPYALMTSSSLTASITDR